MNAALRLPNPVQIARNAVEHAGVLRDAGRVRSVKVARSLLGPAVRGLLLKEGKRGDSTIMSSVNHCHFDWTYAHDQPELARLTRAARSGQWDPDRDLDWSQDVDPHDPSCELFSDAQLPLQEIPAYRRLPRRQQEEQRYALLGWMLSQFLHGEQGALFASCQLTEAVAWLDGKLYGSTQVVDEGRHVEVFSRYLDQKLEKRYQINDNLFVVLDAVTTDQRWDVKFLGMQILVEGLALGAFGTMRGATQEPLLRELLRRVITDEARHVHFGVVALQQEYARLSPRDLREREDWAYEICLLARNRFLAHEFYEEYYGHCMSRAAWDELLLGSDFMAKFRHTMFRRIVPNLKRIGLLSEHMRPHYEAIGLLELEHGKAAPDLTAEELIGD
jgi:P-aminobenzoate N-oxygenase AurF